MKNDPPQIHEEFVARFPDLGAAWKSIRKEEEAGPLDEKTVRLVKLGLDIGARREGAIHAAVRKALAAGISREEIEQVVSLAAGTIGLPATVAAYTWVHDVLSGGSS